MKFEIIDLKNCGYKLYEKSSSFFVFLGNFLLMKGKIGSNCGQNENRFNYHGIENALCGKINRYENENWIGKNFDIKRFIIIQMK